MKKMIFPVLFIILSVNLFAQDQVTIYNDNFSLVRTFLELELDKGLQDYYLDDIPSTIEANSVIIHPRENRFEIFSQNYEYDLANTNKILQKYIGKKFQVKLTSQEIFKGILQFTDGQTIGLLDQTTNKLVLINRDEIQNIDLAELPDNFFLKPTLHWRLTAPEAGNYPTEFSYICSGMKWDVTYNAVWNDEEQELELNSWVTINNESGKSFKEVKLKLIAGEVQKIRQPQQRVYDKYYGQATATAESQPQFTEKAFHDFHLYTLSEKVSINNKQTKQLRLFPTTVVNASSHYEYYTNSEIVKSQIEFDNKEKNNLGKPLPKGIIKIYKKDTDDDLLEFIGEDRIDHTPIEEKVKITTGAAFDLVAETKELDYSKPAPRIKESDMQVTIKNRSKKKKTISVLHSIYGDWAIYNESKKFTKKTANQIEFQLEVKPGKEASITWTQRINY